MTSMTERKAITDTERIDWLQRMGREIITIGPGKWWTSYGGPVRDNLRDAIDAAIEQYEADQRLRQQVVLPFPTGIDLPR